MTDWPARWKLFPTQHGKWTLKKFMKVLVAVGNIQNPVVRAIGDGFTVLFPIPTIFRRVALERITLLGLLLQDADGDAGQESLAIYMPETL